MNIFHIFREMFLFGYFGRFIVAVLILNFLYSKNRKDIYLKRGLLVLYTVGACVLALGMFFVIMALTFGGIGGMLGLIFGEISRYFY